ncbi:MAG: rRNA maturation RNase YbeY [Bacteroidales bacterium]
MSPDDQRPTAALQVVITDLQGRRLRKPALARWLRSVAPARARGVLSVALVADAAMRRINRDFAGHDHVTDVLSFPAAEDLARQPTGRHRGRPLQRGTGGGLPPPAFRLPPHLGDVVIALGRARRQAAEAGHSLDVELRILALHGLLHVLGYDHATDTGAMAGLEARLRRKGGLGVGLIERAGGARRAGA